MANPNPSPATRFRPGKSGNPGGCPKGRSITARLREILESDRIGDVTMPGDAHVADILAQTIMTQAINGDYRFVELVINRIDGKIPDKISIGSDVTSDTIREYLLGQTESPQADC
jgi:Family of unknown function (DUF5681)